MNVIRVVDGTALVALTVIGAVFETGSREAWVATIMVAGCWVEGQIGWQGWAWWMLCRRMRWVDDRVMGKRTTRRRP